ncbi:hypothetical protein [Curtobacterium sp. MCPF17_052]|uniref:hypothetical protein n=1 Tax=Curtobacterium sp. MCPF17_052 TaxID=2175655 RepID=UPI0024E00AE0|nr:hypothetical protein [Curtobacterium sp. MCPF17_052]WIB14071.1 hypothetical protein DEJ36_16695 [Curtobacterium sp. MCPF17_052]
MLVVERASVERDWATLPRARSQSREIRLSGTLAPGSRLRAGGSPHLVYDDPLPASITAPGPGSKGATDRAVILEVWDNGDATEVLVLERLPVGGGEPHTGFPVALAPSSPPAGEAAARGDRRMGRRGARRTAGDAARSGARPPPARAASRAPRTGRGGRHGGCRGGDPAQAGPVVPGDPGASRHRQDVRRVERRREARPRARVAGRRRRTVARDERELPRRGHRRRGPRRPGGEAAEERR